MTTQQPTPQPGPPTGPRYGAPVPAYDQERVAAHPHEFPRLYPQMLRTWTYDWWRPLVGLLLFVAGALVVLPLVLLAVLAVAVALQGGDAGFGREFSDALQAKTVTPASMLYLNLTLASLTLLAMFNVRVLHRMRPRWLSSVLPGIRWKFLFACFGMAVIALLASLIVGSFLPGDATGMTGSVQAPTGRLLATAVIIVLTTPLQALGEEYGFRGYLMMVFGSIGDSIAASWGASRRTAELIGCSLALLLTATLFALAHGVQNFPLFFDRFAFGLMAGLVVILVGGLEAGIALHVLNNLLAFGIAVAFDQLDSTLNVSQASWWQLPVTVVQNGVFLLLVLWLARRMGLRRRSEPAAATSPGRFAAEERVV